MPRMVGGLRRILGESTAYGLQKNKYNHSTSEHAAAQAEVVNANGSHSQSGLKYHAVSTRWCTAYVLKFLRPSTDSAARDANQHFLPAAKRDLLASMECSSTQAADASDNRSNPGPFAPAENSAQQGTCTGADRCVLDGFA